MPNTTLQKAIKDKPFGRICLCLQCGYRWPTRLIGRDPLNCPKCKSWYWRVHPEVMTAK